MPPSLPTDVVQIIQDKLFAYEDDSLLHLYGVIGRRTWLAQVLTFSRAWYTATIPLLYRAIEVDPADEVTLNLLLRTLRGRPQLAALVRVFRAYERKYKNHDPHLNSHADIIPDRKALSMMKLILQDHDKRRKAQEARCMHIVAALARVCNNLEELLIDGSNVKTLCPVLKSVVYRLRRLVLEDVYRLDMTALCNTADWSNLRSLTLDPYRNFGMRSTRKHGDLCPLDAALFEKMTNLVELELFGWVRPERMRDILHILQRTLRTLACDQPVRGMQPFEWLAPVKETLQVLTLFIRADEPMRNLSSLTAVKELHIVVLNENYAHYSDTIHSEWYSKFPPAVESVEWTYLKPSARSSVVKQRVHVLLAAANIGATPNLRTVVSRFTINRNIGESFEDAFDQSIQLQCTQMGLNYRMQLDDDCSYFYPEDAQDAFALTAHARRVERAQRLQNREKSGASTNIVRRGLMRAVSGKIVTRR